MTLTTLVIVALAIVVSLAVGHAQPLPDRVAMLHLDMCKPPCWIGITSGVTTLDEAEKRIREVYPETRYQISNVTTVHDLEFTIQDLENQIAFTIQLGTYQNSIVQGFNMFSTDTASVKGEASSSDQILLSLGELNILWGSPNYIELYSCSGEFIPYYNSEIISSFIVAEPSKPSGTRVSWNSSVIFIQMFMVEINVKDRDDTLRHWRGFASYNDYDFESWDCE